MAKAKQQSEIPEQAQPAIVRANVQRRNERSETFVSLYANDAQVQTTPWDIRITFGQIVGAPTAGSLELVVKEIADLRMSPQFAKRVALVLITQLEHYERTVGPIPLPED
jgi:hypothetical protein